MTITNPPAPRPLPKTPAIAASVAAVMVAGGFAMLAVVPIILTLASTLWSARSRPLRSWAGAAAGPYTVGLLIWVLRANPAPSLTKDLHPVLAVLIIAAALTVVVRYAVLARRSRRSTAPDARRIDG